MLILGCITGLGCSSHQPTISAADLQAQLQPLKTIETYAGFDTTNNLLYLGNRFIERWIYLNKNSKPVQTIRYIYKPSDLSYVNLPSDEFQFRVGELKFSGDSKLLRYDSYRSEQGFEGSRRITIQLTYISEAESKPIFHLMLHYEIPPDLPVIRKWFTVQNLTDSAFFIEDIVIESLPFFAADKTDLQIWGADLEGTSGGSPPYGYALTEEAASPPWVGGASEGFVFVQDTSSGGGVVLGNNAPGVLKYYQIYSNRETVSIGLTPTMSPAGSEIRVPPKQSASSPVVWSLLFSGDRRAVCEALKRLVEFPLRCSGESGIQNPLITWTQVSPEWRLPPQTPPDNLIAVDYDWNSENLAALKQMSQRVHDVGEKFGIRLPIAEINTAFLDRPSWRLTPVAASQLMSNQPHAPPIERDEISGQKPEESAAEKEGEEQQPANAEAKPVIYCVLSDYGYYLSQAVNALLEETKADLLVFDRPIIGAPDSMLKGCDAFGHAHYSRAESINLIYQRVFAYADSLHREYPKLQLGITSTAYGVDHPDLACLAHFDLFFQ